MDTTVRKFSADWIVITYGGGDCYYRISSIQSVVQQHVGTGVYIGFLDIKAEIFFANLSSDDVMKAIVP